MNSNFVIQAHDLAAIVSGKKISGEGSLEIKYISVDSRNTMLSSETLFIAIKGAQHNGHEFVSELYDKGVCQFLLEDQNISLPKNAYVTIVPDSLKALQKLVAFKRQCLPCPVLGITGSNAKTIIKEWLYQMISGHFSVLKSPKSYNSQIGVPLSVWGSAPYFDFAIFEAGISTSGEMEHLEKMIRPDIGLFTNIGSAHDEGFPDRNTKIREKLKLFAGAQRLVYCADHIQLAAEIAACEYAFERVSWSRKSTATYQIPNIVKQGGQFTLYMSGRDKQAVFRMPECDQATLENIIHCLVVGMELGIDQEILQQGLGNIRRINMRLEIKDGIQNCQIVDDSYNNDLHGLSIALDFLNKQSTKPYKWVILSEMEQTGRAPKELMEEIAAEIKNASIDQLVLVGKKWSAFKHLFSSNSLVFDTTVDLIQYLKEHLPYGASILIKGARSFKFELLVQALQQKHHGTVLEIDLDSVAHNLNYYRTLAGVKIMAMVKALAYGSGSKEIASLLQHHRVEYLAVAYTDEGVSLRTNGISLPIMVTSPSPASFNSLCEYQLEPEIYSLELLEQWIRYLAAKNIKGPKIHLKLDTGMNRLGFTSENELISAVDSINMTSNLEVASIFSHLAASEDPTQDSFTRQQIALFDHFSKIALQKLQSKPYRHILNTAGIARFPEARFDMVRLGLGLYGISSNPKEQVAIKPVSAWKTIVLQVKQVKAGATIGYGRLGKAERPMEIATLAIGYADGFSRSLGNGNFALIINGRQAPTIGNVCMDMTMVDVTGLDVKLGDEAIVFDQEHSIHRLASAAHTIPYEVLTNIHDRVKRVFFSA